MNESIHTTENVALTYDEMDALGEFVAYCTEDECLDRHDMGWCDKHMTPVVEQIIAARVAEAKAEERASCREEMEALREAFLPSPNLDPAWIAGWHAGNDHATHVLSLPRFIRDGK